MENCSNDFNSLSKRIEEIAHQYCDCKDHINSVGGFLNPNFVDFENPNSKYMDRVNAAYSALNEIERSIINNDFFYQAYPNWWKKYYTRSKYYLIKKRSMMSFLEAFENEA